MLSFAGREGDHLSEARAQKAPGPSIQEFVRQALAGGAESMPSSDSPFEDRWRHGYRTGYGDQGFDDFGARGFDRDLGRHGFDEGDARASDPAGEPWTDRDVQRRPGRDGAAAADDPFRRLIDSEVGKAALDIIGNEDRTLDAIQTLSVDLLSDATRGHGYLDRADVRHLYVPGQPGVAPTLLILVPDFRSSPERITADIPVDPARRTPLRRANPRSREERVRKMLLDQPERIEAAFDIARPEVVLARQPRMRRLCLPDPLLRVDVPGERSTGGIYCRDQAGRLGITACFHGTGPVGTLVTVGGWSGTVTLADPVQDLVFIPLPDGVSPSTARGRFPVLCDQTPSLYSDARFEGLTSGAKRTKITSHDTGLLRIQSGAQRRVQTLPDGNEGDSGSALVDSDNNIIGFAFESTGFGDVPQYTDWVWACNALGSLKLTAI